MKNELFSIGPFTVYGYGFMIGLGILAGFMTAGIRAKKKGMDPEILFDIALALLAGGLLGAKLLYLLIALPQILADPSMLRDCLSDGFVVIGGLLLGMAFIFMVCRRKGQDVLSWLDLIAPSVALGQSFGRIGCLLAGCCYGKETDHAPFIVFSHSDYAPNHVPLIPTQIYSSLLDLALFLFLLWLDRKKPGKGTVTAAYLLAYSLGRFFLEFLRGDEARGFVGFLSTSQFTCLILFLAVGVFLLIRKVKKSEKA